MVRVLGDNILVKLEKPTEEKDLGSGVVLHYPKGSHGHETEMNVWGEVLAVGPGKWGKRPDGVFTKQTPPEVAVGDRVLVMYYLTKVESMRAQQVIFGEDTIIIKPEDIICAESR
jgi:co-chaperonin GroES (HSP10)